MDKKEIRALAEELLILLTPEEEAQFAEEIAYFKNQSELIGEIPGVDEATPLIFPYEKKTTYLRNDEVESTPTTDEILKNSSNKKGEFIVIPKVVK